MDNLKQKLHRLQALELWLVHGGSYQKFEMAEKILVGFTAIDDATGELTTLDGSPLGALLPAIGAEYPEIAAQIKPPPPVVADPWRKVQELRESGELGAKKRDNPQS